MPHHGDHHIIGIKELIHGARAWQKETAHQVEIGRRTLKGSRFPQFDGSSCRLQDAPIPRPR